MEFQGMTGPYPVNRYITDQEKADKLEVKIQKNTEPRHQLFVIKINSTYLECVDKFFGWKGFVSLVSLTALIIMATTLIAAEAMILIDIINGENVSSNILYMTLIFFACGSAVALGAWMLSKESFRLTHFPIRFNRKNRMVYAFRLNGTVLSASWDELFFTLGRAPKGTGSGCWEVRAHVLAADKKTVLETFALPYFTDRHHDQLYSQWEFVRQYMEQGPGHLIGQVEHLMKVANRRESFWDGFHRLLAEFGSAPWLAVIMTPLMFVIAIGRQFAKWTSEIPVWPKEIEAVCAVAPDDPYVKE